ncbi:SusD-like starch-binding protein associating with outer membrane [Mucilaginibacter gracilis]|uniref:SusD-like starch-binding protein associating with outer membrane n=1 Tax=Mucilaginibacter gracilis TaxID=423350 RepID=A0A495J5F4_9SPHI|nr:RagB/SusD family nutrient uptake outer membrane protein [Mucilaginibacter gracilis]RKR83983.1 SusD-like starch-binding protein associating with outer membrane [Mucilaginibacter gracilis]
MKKILSIITWNKRKVIINLPIFILCSFLISGCGKDYLGIVPKGQVVPKTIADYRAFLENTMLLTHDGKTKRQVVNEIFQTSSQISDAPYRNNYLWIATIGARIDATASDGTYDGDYSSLFYYNLVINDVPKISGLSSAQVKEATVLVAQAKVFRALFYFHLINTYAKAYNPASANTDGGVPYISTADDFETPVPQLTVAQIYGHIMDDLNSAIPVMDDNVINFVFPTKTAAIGLRARIHLFMHNFNDAQADAETVLAKQSFIYNMVNYFNTNIDPNGTGNTIQNNRSAFGGLPQICFTDANAENLWVVGGLTNIDYSPAFTPSQNRIPLSDSAGNQFCTRGPGRFEDGDTRFLCNFYRNSDNGYYDYRRVDYANTGGIRTLEVYLIRAECNARQGTQAGIDKAMDDLDAIRAKRIIASKYIPWKGRVTTKAQAIDLIRHERDVELFGTDMMFYDMKRFNTETEYQRTMIKTDDSGVKRTLTPGSDLWIMPFPRDVTEKNPLIKQNTSI